MSVPTHVDGAKVDQDDLEDILLQIMGDEFETALEDNSERKVSSRSNCAVRRY